MLSLYVARDRDGSLFLYGDKPERDMDSGTWLGNFIKVEDSFCEFVTWKDEPEIVIVKIPTYSDEKYSDE